MSNKLLIVESPTKAHTIKRILGGKFVVLSSRGHIKDLPKSKLGIDLENNFTPTYIKIRGKGKIINELKKAAKKAHEIYLGTDPDREGEAIAFHIAEEIQNSKKPQRVLFYEITKRGIEKGLNSPLSIDQNKVFAHTARRVLDRLVGYLVSPILWKTIKSGLSAGRVQTVALRLIIEREREIEKFIPDEYWLIKVIFSTETKQEFAALLAKINNQEITIKNQQQAEEIIKELKSITNYCISQLKITTRHIKPPPPFITATLQQEASRKLNFSSKKTMFLAQQLFEGIKLKDEEVGLITYPRTDSVRIAEEFINMTRQYIKEKFGENYLPDKARTYKERILTQGAHEAIRPTVINYEPETIKSFLTQDQFKLYDLIYRRYLASQMSDAEYLTTDVEITGGKYTFKAQDIKQIFNGFEKILSSNIITKSLPPLKQNQLLYLKNINPEQHFTQPPARYSEAGLIKKLQTNGIGRPSTYATIVSTVLERRYVEKKQGRLWPTKLGFLVYDILIPHFDNIFEINFTKEMEDKLDLIEAAKESWQKVISNFYEPFKQDLDKMHLKSESIKHNNIEQLSEKCPECGKNLIRRWGRYGQFVACSGYPQCKYIKKDTIQESLNLLQDVCPKCGKQLTERIGRYGKFIACSGYPQCKYIVKTSKEEPIVLPEKCPECGKNLVQRKGRFGNFVACSGFPKCRYKKTIKKHSSLENNKT